MFYLQEDTIMNLQENAVMFEAYVTNLGRYNEGTLVGEWVGFPTTAEQMQDVFERIGIDGINYEEYFITDYELPAFNSKLYDMFGEYENLDELNYLAKRMEESGIDPQKLGTLLEMETPSNIGDAINAIKNKECYTLLSDVYTNEDLGYYYIEESGIYNLSSMGNLANYIDYEAFGRDIAMDLTGGFTEHGFIEQIEEPTEYYSGFEDIPDEAKVMNFPKKEQQKEKSEQSKKPSLRQNIEAIKNNQKEALNKNASSIKKDSQER